MLDDDVHPAEPLLRSTVVVTASSLATKGLAFVRVLIAARLLQPAEFGRFAFVVAVLGVVEAFAQPGVSSAVQQLPEATRDTYRTAFTFLAARGVLLTALTLALADPVADAFKQPDSSGLLAVAGLAFLARGFASTRVLERARRVDLLPYAIATGLGALGETVVAVSALALGHRNAGALVAAFVAGALIETIASWIAAGPPHGLGWSRFEFARLLPVSRWVFVSSSLEYLATTGDDLVVARILGVRDLGLYRVSYRIASLPTTEISHTVGRVALPALSRRAERGLQVVRSAHTRTVVLVGGLAASVAAVLCATASSLVEALLGPAWRDAAILIVILAAAGWVRAVVATAGPLLTGMGRPALATAILAVRAVALAIGLAVLIGPYELEGAALASLLSVVSMIIPWLWALRRVGLPTREVVAGVASRIPLALAVGAITFASTRLFASPVLDLVVAAPVALCFWVVGSRRLDPELATLVRSTLRRPARESV